MVGANTVRQCSPMAETRLVGSVDVADRDDLHWPGAAGAAERPRAPRARRPREVEALRAPVERDAEPPVRAAPGGQLGFGVVLVVDVLLPLPGVGVEGGIGHVGQSHLVAGDEPAALERQDGAGIGLIVVDAAAHGHVPAAHELVVGIAGLTVRSGTQFFAEDAFEHIGDQVGGDGIGLQRAGVPLLIVERHETPPFRG